MQKKRIATLCLLCLALIGCNGYEETHTAEETTTQEWTVENEVDTIAQSETETTPLFPSFPTVGGQISQLTGDSLPFEHAGKARIPYTANVNFVRYVTSTDMISGYDVEGLAHYDEAFFAEKALVLVCETVTSGSVQVEIDSIIKDGSLVSVVLSHEMPGDVGTADMATWLIWAEVDRDMTDCQWTLHNPALPSQFETQ